MCETEVINFLYNLSHCVTIIFMLRGSLSPWHGVSRGLWTEKMASFRCGG